MKLPRLFILKLIVSIFLFFGVFYLEQFEDKILEFWWGIPAIILGGIIYVIIGCFIWEYNIFNVFSGVDGE